ncbi:hypothetical protein, partial [Salmonella sp. s51933]|uniref:hypothetical protein n=1 Tax=Salmonella sp. s51933 TaxID=3160127 RepID=UPI0037551103
MKMVQLDIVAISFNYEKTRKKRSIVTHYFICSNLVKIFQIFVSPNFKLHIRKIKLRFCDDS